ncbi:septal ring lytic transglycosylase RlpA family protein [Candidatus Nitronereus thalassa]|uniref:Probable endolytic peptidoglycan transglycosylase RlpA n=1 Tax=Candidatus Nitronereus thalassa TaxID=3020898 RepID=A0ABU3KC87_9BACT|nr:septal ring lytic transglycosylase RlpA family protein [Candidatus Nitronereus thalassa]MDT7044074.1 septal ring lytic transglycosylase RlpA family protein [Candidatus Nitronereus thalassa]
MFHRNKTKLSIKLMLLFAGLLLPGCSVIETGWNITKGTVKGGYYVVKGAYHLTAGVSRVVYHIGRFTFNVVRAPDDWPLTNNDLETIDGLPVKEAIRQGRVKAAPYVVKGRRYVPMTMEEAQKYEETGTASWYGYETRIQKGGHMTANGEAFDPHGFTAAHKYLPLPINVKVTNLENGRSIIVRVNDRGPFPSINNSHSGKRIIDLSAGAAKRLGFYNKGLAKVHVEVIPVKFET